MRGSRSTPPDAGSPRFARARLAVAGALALLGALAGCGEDATVAPENEASPFVRPDYFDVTRSPGLAFVERDDSTLVFERVADAADPAVGTIIVGVDDGGYIGRVRSARRVGTSLLVGIDPAWAADVVMAGTADTSLQLTLGSTFVAAGSPAAAPLDPVEAAPGVRLSAEGIDLAGATLFAGTAEGSRLTVKIARGRISYAPLVDLGFSLVPGGVHGVTAYVRGSYSLDIEASIEADGPVSLDEEIVIAAVRRDVVMRIGKFPVAARLTLRYIANVRLEGDFSPATTWASAASGELGFGALGHGAIWKKIDDDGVVFGVPSIGLPEAREARAAIAVWPALTIEYYGEPSIETRCAVVTEYRAAPGSAPVIEWEMLGSVNGWFAFSPGRLARIPRGMEMVLGDRTTPLAAGPFKTDRYIFAREWGSEGTTDGAFEYPKGIAVDADGFVYVVDNWNNRVQKFTAGGEFVLGWGEPGTGEGQFDAPEKIAVDPAGIVYVTDAGNARVQRFTAEGHYISSWGGEGTGDGQFLRPHGVAVGGGRVFVTDNLANRAHIFSLDGASISQWGSAGAGEGMFDGPAGCAVSPAGAGRLYVADCRNNRVQAFTLTGAFDAAWGGAGTGEAEFDCPIDVAIDATGSVYVCDLGNDRFQVFAADGVFIASLGSRGSGEGQFDHPEGIAVDAAGNVYVVDGRNRRVQVFAPLAP